MDRVTLKEQKCTELFGGFAAEDNPDKEFLDILQNFQFGEVSYCGDMDDKTRELITIALLTVNQCMSQLGSHVMAAAGIGVSQDEIKETIYHCAPYIGFPKTLNAIAAANEAFKSLGQEIKAIKNATVTETDRAEKGLEKQKSIFGAVIDQAYANAPEGQLHIQEYLSAMCFGDFYTRGVLDTKMRELLTFCILDAQGGCENQLKAHAAANLRVGNDKQTLVNAVTQCLLYVGFPRTLNALNCINEVCG